MALNPLNHHYAMENVSSIYDEEALTALELAGRTTAKVNETVHAFNDLLTQNAMHLANQDKAIEAIRTSTVPAEVKAECERLIKVGEFDKAINLYMGNTQSRLDTVESRIAILSGTLTAGSTTLDAEVIDTRVGYDATQHATAGEAVRSQVGELRDAVDYLVPGMKEPRVIKGTNNTGTAIYNDGYVDVDFGPVVTSESGNHLGVSVYMGKPDAVQGKRFKLTVTNPGDHDMPLYLMLSRLGSAWANIKALTHQAHPVVPAHSTESYVFEANPETSWEDVYLIVRYLPQRPNQHTGGGQLRFTLRRTNDHRGTHFTGVFASNIDSLENIRVFKDTPRAIETVDDLTMYKTDGVYRIEQATINNPNAKTQYYVCSMYLGTLFDLLGKTVHLVTKGGTNRGISTNPNSWMDCYNTPDGESYIKGDDIIQYLWDEGIAVDEENPDLYVVVGRYWTGETVTAPDMSLELFGEILTENFVTANRLHPDVWDEIDDKFTNEGASGIVCWGDSLTAQGGWCTQLGELSGRTVHNCGTGGESSSTIMARQGGDVMVVDGITIPADTTPVQVAPFDGFDTQLGRKATPLRQGGTNHVNPVVIAGVVGDLNFTGTAHNDTTGVYTFTRREPGETVTITKPTAVVTRADRELNKPELMVIYMGQNGGYTNNEDLLDQHRLMIAHAHAKNVIVLGLSSGNTTSRLEYEQLMRKEYGRYFISLREYLSKYALEDAGRTPTAEDQSAMSAGKVPPSLLKDDVHYTDLCQGLIGEMLYEKCVELNIFKEDTP